VIGAALVVPLAVARVGTRRHAADWVLATSLVMTFGSSAYRSMADGQVLYFLQQGIAYKTLFIP